MMDSVILAFRHTIFSDAVHAGGGQCNVDGRSAHDCHSRSVSKAGQILVDCLGEHRGVSAWTHLHNSGRFRLKNCFFVPTLIHKCCASIAFKGYYELQVFSTFLFWK